MGAIEKRSAIDVIILRNARKSPAEIGELAGLSPEAAAERRAVLLRERDTLSFRQRELLMLYEAEDMLETLKSRMEEAKERNLAGLGNAARQVMALIRDINKEKAAADEEIARITKEHARIFGMAYDVALGHIMKELGSEFNIPEETLDAVAEQALSRAAKKIQESVRDDD